MRPLILGIPLVLALVTVSSQVFAGHLAGQDGFGAAVPAVVVLAPHALTPAPTPASSPEVLSEPLQVGAGVEILSYTIVKTTGLVEIVGEYRNITEERIDAPAVRFRLVDTSATVIETAFADPSVPTMEPGEVVGFSSLPVFVSVGEWESEEVSACRATQGENEGPRDTLTLADVNDELVESGNVREISGTIANSGSEAADNVVVVAEFRTLDGRFVGAVDTAVDAAVPAGGDVTFTLRSSTVDLALSDDERFSRTALADLSIELWVGVSDRTADYLC